jgi:hypothetical protein
MGIIRKSTVAYTAASANNIALSQSPGAGAITLNGALVTGGVAILDAARRILFTSGTSDVGITFTVVGTNSSGSPMTETIQGGATTASTTQDFKTVSSVTHSGSVAGTLTIGTSGVGSGNWLNIDTNADPVNATLAVVVAGTINYSVEFTLDDPNALAAGVFPTPLTTSTIMPAALVGATNNQSGLLVTPVWGVRLTQNSFTFPGTAILTMIQAGPYH